MIESDYEYFRRRAGEERLAAERAPDPQARTTHEELASRYEAIIEQAVLNLGLISDS